MLFPWYEYTKVTCERWQGTGRLQASNKSMDVGIDSTDDAAKPTRRRRVRRSTSSTVSLPDLDHSHATAIEALLTRVGELEFNIQSMEKNARKDLQVMDMRVEAALHCAVEATEAVRRNELQAKYAKGLDGRVPRDGEDARADEENVIPQTVDVESRQNLFTFALERSVMRPDLSALSVTREVVATAFLLWIQTIYCFGFEDASNLLQLQDNLSPYTARRLTHECPALSPREINLCTLSLSPLHALNAPCGLCVCAPQVRRPRRYRVLLWAHGGRGLRRPRRPTHQHGSGAVLARAPSPEHQERQREQLGHRLPRRRAGLPQLI